MNLTPENPVAAQARNADIIRSQVREDYARVAQASGLSDCCCSAHTCCGDAPEVSINTLVSLRLGYSQADLDLMPAGADMGLGCGNPTAIAALRHGEVVADLGAGGGIDAFLAARAVGTSGRVIGIDMTPDMVSKARHHAERGGFANVEFRLGEIEYLPLADASVDVILSNCVINLSPDKPQVFQESFRVLKPGGRLAISDVVATANLPPEWRDDPKLHSGCMAGAAPIQDLEAMLETAGFTHIAIRPKEQSREFIRDWAPGRGVEDYLVAAIIEAIKPDTST
ncbi:MAG: arsenite methyltransferase [Chromatiaceae bacterium]